MKSKKIALFVIIILCTIFILGLRFTNSLEHYEDALREDRSIEFVKAIELEDNSTAIFSKKDEGIVYAKLRNSLFGLKETEKGYQNVSEFLINKGFSVLDISSKSKIVIFGMMDELNVDYIKLEFEDMVIIPNIVISEQNSYWYYTLEKDEKIKYKSVTIKAIKNGNEISEMIYDL